MCALIISTIWTEADTRNEKETKLKKNLCENTFAHVHVETANEWNVQAHTIFIYSDVPGFDRLSAQCAH